MDNYTDTDTYFDDFETENNRLVVVEPDFEYKELIKLCRALLREVRRTRNHDEILRILVHKKQNYERLLGNMVSNEMYDLITLLIQTGGGNNNIKQSIERSIERRIEYYNSILQEFLEEIDSKALDNVTTTYDNMYNRQR